MRSSARKVFAAGLVILALAAVATAANGQPFPPNFPGVQPPPIFPGFPPDAPPGRAQSDDTPPVPQPTREMDEWFNEIKPVEINAQDNDLTKLLKQRHNAGREEVRARDSLYRAGRMALEDVLAAQQRFAKAGVEMAQTQAERLKYLQMAVDAARTVEFIVRDKFVNEVEPVQSMARATRCRLTAEIDLLRAQSAPSRTANGRTGAAGPTSELRKLLTQRFEAAAREEQAYSTLYRGGRVALDDVLEAIKQRAHAGVEMSQTSAERVQHLEGGLEQAKEIEEIVRDKFENTVEPPQAMHFATCARLGAEIALVCAKQAANAPASPKQAAQANAISAKLKELLQARYQAATDEVAARRALYQGGRVSLDDVLESVQRQVMAGVEMATTPAEKVKHLQVAFEAAKEAEGIVQGKFMNDVEPVQAMQQATYTRLDAEIALARARGTAPTGAAVAAAKTADALVYDDSGRLPQREWIDNTGRFQAQARPLLVLDGKVRLLKESGRTTTVPLGRLSAADCRYVAEAVGRYGSELTPISGRGPVEAPGASQSTWEIVGFYGAANDGGTFLRTVEEVPVKVGDRILVTGTGLYDGNWTVLQKFQYRDPMDPQSLWGYRIEPKWQGLPVGFTLGGRAPAGNTARLQPLQSAEAPNPREI